MINPGFIAVVVLSVVHLFANRPTFFGWVWKNNFLSFASGISLAYVFVDLLPAIEKGTPALKRTFGPFLPYLDRHTYVIALLGILFYYGIQTLQKKHLLLRASGYLLFNFFIGATLSDSSNPEIQPLTLFTIAIALHYFVRDHISQMSKNTGVLIALVLCLFAGYFIAYITKIPDTVTAIGTSFAAGGVILNLFTYELPKKEGKGYLWFLSGALIYTLILLGVGAIR